MKGRGALVDNEGIENCVRLIAHRQTRPAPHYQPWSELVQGAVVSEVNPSPEKG